VLDALEAAIRSCDPDKRAALAKMIEGWHHDFPEDFHWAVGAQSPSLLANLVMAIDAACRPDTESKPKPVRIVDRGLN